MSIMPGQSFLPAVLLLALLGQQPGGRQDTFDTLLHRAFAFHQQADYQDALPLLQQAYKLDPHDYFVNLLLGIEMLRTGNPGKAIDLLGAAARLRPKEDFPYEYSGEAQAQLGRYDQASAAYMKAVAVAPDGPEAIEGWIDFSLERFRQLAGQLRSSQAGLAAEYRLQARSYPGAEKKRSVLLEQSAALDPDQPGIWSELALADLAAGDDAEAQKNVVRALAANSNDLNAAMVQAWLAAKAGDWTRAVDLLNQVAARSPGFLAAAAPLWPPQLQPPQKNLAAGAAAKFLACVPECPPSRLLPGGQSSPAKLFQQERWDGLAALPAPANSDPEAWFQRGVAFAQLGQCEHAIPALERGLAAPTEVVYARFLLSWCYADAAGKVDARLRRSGAEPAIAHMIRGDVFFRMQGETAPAMVEYQAALAARGDDPKLLERLAEVQVAAGDFAAAEQNAGRALELDSHRYSARQTLARIAMEQGRYADALPQLKLLAAQDPHDQGTQISLATTLAQLGDSLEALQHLEPLLAGGYPDQKGSLHSLLGSLLRKAGRPAEAAQAFATARQLSEAYQQTSHRDQEEPR